MTVSTACESWDNSGCVGTPFCPPRCPRYFDPDGRAYLIRPFEASDFDGLVAMYESLDPELRTMGLPPDGPEGRKWWLSRLTETGWNLIALYDDRVAGHIGVAPATAREPEFVVFVHQADQGRGLGTELVKQAVAYAADDGHDGLTLTVSTGNRRAIHVYENVGFTATDASELADVDVEMELPMSSPVAEQVRRPPAERDRRQ